MSLKAFKIVRILIAMFIGVIVSVSVTTANMYLALSAIIIGIIIMILAKRRVKDVMVDEMMKTIAYKAASIAYSTSVVVLALLSLILVFTNLDDQNTFNYRLGIVFSYIVLFSMAVYSFAHYFYRKKYGTDEE